jgi:hypothetical protein
MYYISHSLLDLKYLFAAKCAFHMYAVRYDVYQHHTFSLISLHTLVVRENKLTLINITYM